MLVTVIDQLDRPPSRNPRNPTAISLFSGAGGCSLGFQQATYDIRFAVDIDADAVASYRRNFSQTSCEVADIREFSGDMLLQRAQLNQGGLDVLLGGPPCAGARDWRAYCGDVWLWSEAQWDWLSVVALLPDPFRRNEPSFVTN